MKLRAALAVLALVASAMPAQARLAAVVTAVAADGTELGDQHELHCTREVCRGNLPIIILGRTCHLNVHVTLPDQVVARVLLATDGCQPELRIGSLETSAVIMLKPNGILSQVIGLPYQREAPGLVRELVLRRAIATVRLDLARMPDPPQR
jgi:hypothetical protein